MNYVPTAQWEIQSHIWRKTLKKLLFFLILPSFITQFCLLWLVFNLLYIEGNKKISLVLKFHGKKIDCNKFMQSCVLACLVN